MLWRGRGWESTPVPPWVFNSGHLMASLSSKSLKRFLENFQMKKAMMAITAMPPATDMPMMGPIPILLLVSVCEVEGIGVPEEEEEEEAEFG